MREAIGLISSLLEHGVSAAAVPCFVTWVALAALPQGSPAARQGSPAARQHSHGCVGEEQAQADNATINSSSRDVVAEKILLCCPLNLIFI